MNYVILEKAKQIKTIGVDFDGTLVEVNKLPISETKLLSGAKEGLERFKKDGWTIIIYTCRAEKEYSEIVQFLVSNDVPFDYINENPLQFQTNSSKLYCDVMIDDKVVTFRGWKTAFDDVIKLRKELDKKRPEDQRVLKKAKKKAADSKTITIKCSPFASEQLMGLLKQLKFFGNVGHSATIRTDPRYGENKGKESKDFGFDGDGSAKIYSIELDGEDV